MRRLLVGGLVLLPSVAWAAETVLIPVERPSFEEENRRLAASGKQTLTLTGRGDRLRVTYTSAVPIDLDVAPMIGGTSFHPFDLRFTTLPPGIGVSATVDLTRTSDWTPWKDQYYVALSVPKSNDSVRIDAMQILPARAGTILSAGVRHFFQSEPFYVNTPHSLSGYAILSLPVSLLLGILTVLVVFVRWRRGTETILGVIIIALLLYAARWNVDLLRFSIGHLAAWETEFQYGEAGSAYEVAQVIREEERRGRGPVGLFVCTSSSNFTAKLLRYALFPLPVWWTQDGVTQSSHILVRQAGDWWYRDGVLHCGPAEGRATLLKTFSDGSQLFTSQP